jgi:tetratricopeptide (TPR) repeat protein
MKNAFIISLLVLMMAAGAQLALAQGSTKVIQDPAEYNAYMSAINTQDPAARAAAFDTFINQYPNSVVKVDAYEQAMAAYQQAGNQAKVESTARTLLGMNANNVRALAILAYLDRAKATQGDSAALKEGCAYGQKGTEALPAWSRPETISDADFGKLRNQMVEIFEGVAGFCALQAKDYAGARDHYLKSFQLDPANMQDVYQLGIACTLMTPMDANGLWYLAKAINLANEQKNDRAAQGIATYAKAKYRQYHGSEDGWDKFVAAVASQTAPPAAMADLVKPAPTKCDIAVEAVAQNKVEELSFSDWEFILAQRGCSPAGNEAADKVWQAIQAEEKNGQAMLKIPVKVITSSRDSLEAAVTEENQKAEHADIHVALQKPLLHPPAPGAMIDVIGIITNYAPNPFMFTMEKGAVPSADPPVEAPHHNLVHHKK